MAAIDQPGKFFPPIGAPENELLDYRDRVINRWSVYRNRHMGRIGLSMAYVLGRQWSEIDYAAAFDGIRGVVLREMGDEGLNNTIVRPVTNEIDPGVEAEVIALVKRRWTPKVYPQNNDPRIKAAAQVAHDRLNYRLEQLLWREKRHQLGYHFAVTGLGLVYTADQRSYMNLKPIGAPTAVFCEACQTKLYSARVPVDTLRLGTPHPSGLGYQPVTNLDTARDVMPDETQDSISEAELTHCPTCPDRQPLQPYAPTPDEAASGADIFGRPLGIDAPRGQDTVEIDMPQEFYPQNGGLKVAPDTLRRYGRRKIRSLEWVEEYYPHLVHLVEPESASELLYGDPLFGSWEMLSSWSTMLDAGILDNEVNVDEVVEEPSFRHPHGRYLVCTKDVVLEDSALLESAQVPGETPDDPPETLWVRRVMESVSRFKIRPGEIWGTTIADNEISPQNRLNGIDSQVVETRLRMGSPNIHMPFDMWPEEGPTQDDAYGSGMILLTQPSTSQPQAKPETFGGIIMPPEVYQERDRVEAGMRRRMGPQDATIGAAPKNVGTTSGLQLLTEQDERSRSLREDELVNSVERAWGHLLEIEWVLHHDDEDVYRVLGPNKTYKYEQYAGQALRGQTEVKIERGTFISRSLVQREAAREALADHVIEIDSPVARRRIAELYGLDTDINEDTTVQVDHAERVWVDFADKGVVRVQDSLDIAPIHYLVLGTHLENEEGEKLATESGWPDIARAIAGWEDELRQLIMLEAQSIAFYGGRLSGQDAEVAFAKANVAYEEQVGLYKQQAAIAQQQQAVDAKVRSNPNANPNVISMPPPQTPLPPQPPPPPLDIPVLMQDRVLLVWMSMLERKGLAQNGQLVASQPGQDVEAGLRRRDPIIYVKFRALTEAYKLTMSLGAMSPMGPGAVMSPGAGATMAPVDKGGPVGGGGAVPAAAATGPPSPPATGPMPGGGKN